MKIRAETAEREVQALVKKQINVQIDSSSEIIQLRKEYEQLWISYKEVKAEKDLLQLENQVLQNISTTKKPNIDLSHMKENVLPNTRYNLPILTLKI